MSDTAERVKKIVVEHLGVDADKVTEGASFIDDLGADSLDTVELVMAFEEEFGVEIPDDAAETILTVALDVNEDINVDENVNTPVNDEVFELDDTSDVFDKVDEASLVAETSHTKSFKAIFEEDDQLPEALPKSGKQRHLDEDIDLFDDDMSQIFDEALEENYGSRGLPRWIILAVVAILIITLAFFGFGRLMASEPVHAKFVIEPLRDDRIAFMNTSSGEKAIEAYSWEIYYADTLVQTFNDKNLFPVFDTEGDYKIVLKVKEKNGEWSEPYSEIYEYRAKEQ